jgi:hypothetical protein
MTEIAEKTGIRGREGGACPSKLGRAGGDSNDNGGIWTPYYKTHVDRLEKVQYRFFKFIRWKLPSQISYSYSLSLCYLGLATLDVRRKYFALWPR